MYKYIFIVKWRHLQEGDLKKNSMANILYIVYVTTSNFNEMLWRVYYLKSKLSIWTMIFFSQSLVSTENDFFYTSVLFWKNKRQYLDTYIVSSVNLNNAIIALLDLKYLIYHQNLKFYSLIILRL